jgi:hypothetical protein
MPDINLACASVCCSQLLHVWGRHGCCDEYCLSSCRGVRLLDFVNKVCCWGCGQCLWTSKVWVCQMCVCEGDNGDMRACAQDGASCLFIACQQGHLDVAKYLCERGGERLLMLTTDVSACTCFAACCMQCRMDVVTSIA